LLEAKLFNGCTTSTLIDATAILNGGRFELNSALAEFGDEGGLVVTSIQSCYRVMTRNVSSAKRIEGVSQERFGTGW